MLSRSSRSDFQCLIKQMNLSISRKLNLVTILLFVAITSIVTMVFYGAMVDLLVDHAVEDISSEIQDESSHIQSKINTQHADVMLLANVEPTQSYFRADLPGNKDDQTLTDKQQWLDRLTRIFTTLIETRPFYKQVRLIDNSGMEIVRVERVKNKIIVVPADALQNKAARDYVSKTLLLSEGKVYVSDVSLNRERGKITEPHEEIVRIASPVFIKGQGKKPEGLVVINVDAGEDFRLMQKRIRSHGMEVYITNNKGDYLLHPDKTKTYGHEFGRQYRAQDDYPGLAEFYTTQDAVNSKTLITNKNSQNEIVIYRKIVLDKNDRKRFVVVGITRPYDSLKQSVQDSVRIYLMWGLMLIVLGVLLIWFITTVMLNPLQAIVDAIQSYSADKEQNVEIKNLSERGGDEISALARAYLSMVSTVKESQEELANSNLQLEKNIKSRTRSLQESEARQSAIVESMVDGLITISDKGIIQDVNKSAEKIFGFTQRELLGNNINMLMPEPDSSAHDGYLENFHRTSVAKIIGIGREVEGKRKDGSTFPMDLSVNKIQVEGNVMYSGIVRDITERKRVEKLKNEFVSTVSHELRTPLTSIRGALDLITGGAAGKLPDEANSLLDIASNNTERLLLLINDILDIQKIESGIASFKFSKSEIMPIIERAVEENAAYAQQYDVNYQIVNSIDDGKVFVDPDRVIQVMNNLLSNAAKYSPQGGLVEINVSRHSNDVIRVAVTDHGKGIPEDFQSKLFDKFTQSDSSDTRRVGGTGLGLSIAKAIVEKHGGKMGFLSSENIGTTMYFELPVHGDKYSEIKTQLTSPIMKKDGQNFLVVEDDEDVAAMLKHMLAELGFDSDIARNTRYARELLEKNEGKYCAITLDIMMPDENGISFIKSLRDSEKYHDLPVVVISAVADEARRELTGGAVSVVDWLQKPIDRNKLNNVITMAATRGKRPRILHVEDDPDIHTVVDLLLGEKSDVTWARNLKESTAALKDNKFDMILLDVGLPDGSGLELLKSLDTCDAPPEVVIFSANSVSQECADNVAAVLLKSNTKNDKLVDVIQSVLKQA